MFKRSFSFLNLSSSSFKESVVLSSSTLCFCNLAIVASNLTFPLSIFFFSLTYTLPSYGRYVLVFNIYNCSLASLIYYGPSINQDPRYEPVTEALYKPSSTEVLYGPSYVPDFAGSDQEDEEEEDDENVEVGSFSSRAAALLDPGIFDLRDKDPVFFFVVF